MRWPRLGNAARTSGPRLPNGFDETFYLAANPDVRTAIAAGVFASAAAHYVYFGYWEGRSFRPDPQASAATQPGQPSRMVHVGRDDWLFLTGGTNSVLTQYCEAGFTSHHLARWETLMRERARLCRETSTSYLNVAVPEKLSIYDRELDGLPVDPRFSPADRLWRALRFTRLRRTHLDLVHPFRTHPDRARLYHRTDTHWTFAGCFLAYTLVCRRLGARPRDDLADSAHRDRLRMTGDLGAKLEPPRGEEVESWNYPRRATRVHAGRLVRHFEQQGGVHWGGIGSHVVYRNEESGVDPRRLVFFGDSYSQHGWHPWVGGLTAMLAETFREVHFIWTSGIDWTYVRDVRPDIVLTEIAERFMIEVPLLHIDLGMVEAEALGRKAG